MPGKKIQRYRAYKQIVKQHGVGGKVVAKRIGVRRNLLVAPIKQWIKEGKVTEKRGHKVLWGIKKMSRKPIVRGSPTADPLSIGVVSNTTPAEPPKKSAPRPSERLEKERAEMAKQEEARLATFREHAKDIRLSERTLEERRAENPSALEEMQKHDEQAGTSAAMPQSSAATAVNQTAALNPEHPANAEPRLAIADAPLPREAVAHRLADEATEDGPTPIVLTPPESPVDQAATVPADSQSEADDTTAPDTVDTAATADTSASDGDDGGAGDMDIG